MRICDTTELTALSNRSSEGEEEATWLMADVIARPVHHDTGIYHEPTSLQTKKHIHNQK